MSASTEAANKDLVARYFEAMERGPIEEALDFWATDAVNYASDCFVSQGGHEALAFVFRMLPELESRPHFVSTAASNRDQREAAFSGPISGDWSS